MKRTSTVITDRESALKLIDELLIQNDTIALGKVSDQLQPTSLEPVSLSKGVKVMDLSKVDAYILRDRTKNTR